MSAAWFCPSCQKHHGPHVDTCPVPADAIGTRTMPTFPPLTLPYSPAPFPEYLKRANQTYPCGCIGNCGNVACPHLMRVECSGAAQ